MDETPFLTTSELEMLWRPLSDAEKASADLFLRAAARWIRERKPTIAPNDVMAKAVSLEVVREAIQAGRNVGLKQYSRTIGQRMESGTVDSAAGLLIFTENMRALLGIATVTRPSISVGSFDESALPPNRILRYRA